MRGQASFELLLVALALFAALGFWLTGVSEATGAASESMAKMGARVAVERLAAAVDQAYFMGDGNAVKVKFTLLEEAELHAAGPKISLEIMGKRYERDTAAPATGSIRLEKGDNTIAASCEKGTVSLVRL